MYVLLYLLVKLLWTAINTSWYDAMFVRMAYTNTDMHTCICISTRMYRLVCTYMSTSVSTQVHISICIHIEREVPIHVRKCMDGQACLVWGLWMQVSALVRKSNLLCRITRKSCMSWTATSDQACGWERACSWGAWLFKSGRRFCLKTKYQRDLHGVVYRQDDHGNKTMAS